MGRGWDNPLDITWLLSSPLLCVAVAVRAGGEPVKRQSLGNALVLTDNLVQRGWWSCMVMSIGPQLTAWW